MVHPWLKGTGGRKFFCHPWATLFRKSVSSKEVFYRRLLVWKNWIRGANKVPSNRKKSWFFFGADWPATSMPSGWSMVPLGAQRTHMCRQRCTITSSHIRDHCGCTTTVRRAALLANLSAIGTPSKIAFISTLLGKLYPFNHGSTLAIYSCLVRYSQSYSKTSE